VVDLGNSVWHLEQLLHTDPVRRRAVGHMVVERRGMRVMGIDQLLPCLPESAHEGGARPWPVKTGWAWAWENTLYRRTPEGRVSVAARLPGPIGAWDVGPDGAVWCVGAGCMWWGPPGRFARRVPLMQMDAAGIALEQLCPGDLLFSDDGHRVVLAETPGVRAICRTGLVPGSDGGTIGWTLDAECVDAEERPAARASPGGRGVWRVSRTRLSVWRADAGVVHHAIALPSPPMDMRTHSDDAITVLTAQGAFGFDSIGRLCEPDLSALLAPAPDCGRVRVGTQDIWWSADGGVVAGLTPP